MPLFFAWTFTLNNPTVEEDPLSWEGVKYIVYQLEQGLNGTPHFQGYLYMQARCGMKKLKELNSRAHWEVRAGTHEQARHYCMKPVDGCQCQHCVPPQPRLGGPWENGELRAGQGERTDLVAVQADLDSMLPMKTIAKKHFSNFIRYQRGIIAYRELQLPIREWNTEVRVYWGPTNIGKSRRAKYEAGPNAYYLMKSRTKDAPWWTGYSGQGAVVINDFYGWMSWDEMLRICDLYPHQVAVHGSMVNFSAKLMIFTSNKHPSNWYNTEKLGVNYETLGRRLTVIGMETEWTEEFATTAPFIDLPPPLLTAETA